MDSEAIKKGLLFIITCVFLTFIVHEILNGLILGYDFPFIWHPGQALFQERINPYCEEVAQRIFFSENHRLNVPPEKILSFMYPVYVLAIPLPLYFISLDWAAAAWLVFNILITVSFIPLFFPDFPKWLGPTLILFYETWFTILMGNYALLIFVFLTIAFCVLIYKEKKDGLIDILCGVSLAWTTGKPQMVWLLIPILLLIGLRFRRFGFVYGFLGGILLLIVISFLLLPNWVWDWGRILLSWPEFSPSQQSVIMRFLYTFFSRDLVWIFTLGFLAVVLAFLIYLAYLWWKGRIPTLILIVLSAFFQNLFDLSGMAPDRLVLIIPIVLYIVSQPANKKAWVVWAIAIIVSNLLFNLSLTGLIPLAGDRYTILTDLAFLFFLVWKYRSTFFHRRKPLQVIG